MMSTIDDRINREREYHNARFTDETRMAQGKFYFATKHGAGLFDEAVAAAARNADILEYGCGVDNLSIRLAGDARSAVGIDISDVAIETARGSIAAGQRNLRFEVMDAENLAVPATSLDLIFGRGIIHHLDLDRSFATIAKSLRPDGKALFWEPLGHNPLLNLYRHKTPDARTPDEHPLVKSDFDLARRYFENVTVRFCGLMTILAVPIRDTAVGNWLLAGTGVIDRLLFKLPGIRWHAWYCSLELSKPRAEPLPG